MMYGPIVTFNKSDPFNRGYEDPIWNPLWTFAERRRLGDPQEIHESVLALYMKL
jgi:hypothetical protein